MKKSIQSTLEKIVEQMIDSHELPTSYLAGLFAVLNAGILFMYFEIKKQFFPQIPTNYFDYLVISFAFFMGGFAGIVCIVRKEYPLFITIKGRFAVINGWIAVLLGWGIALYSLYLAFTKIPGL
jgi:hypothetical protein